jgi:hypothetical protein
MTGEHHGTTKGNRSPDQKRAPEYQSAQPNHAHPSGVVSRTGNVSPALPESPRLTWDRLPSRSTLWLGCSLLSQDGTSGSAEHPNRTCDAEDNYIEMNYECHGSKPARSLCSRLPPNQHQTVLP